MDLLSDRSGVRTGRGGAGGTVEANRGARVRNLAAIAQVFPSDSTGTVLPFRAG